MTGARGHGPTSEDGDGVRDVDGEAALLARLEADLASDATGSTLLPSTATTVRDAADDNDEAEGPRTVAVDPPEPRVGLRGRLGARRVPLVPARLRSLSTLAAAVGWALRTAAHVVGFHVLRLPLYWVRLVARAPRGAGRLLRAWWVWASDQAGRRVHQAITTGMTSGVPGGVAAGRAGLATLSVPGGSPAGGDRLADAPGAGLTGRLDAETFLRLGAAHRSAVRWRLAVSAVLAGLVGPVLVLPLAQVGAPSRVLLAGLVLPLLGLVGRRVDRPVVSRATDAEPVVRLTSDVILTALGSLGIAELNKGLSRGDGVRFPGPISRDGPGWRADVDLPPGVTAGDVIDRRDRLASGLRRPLGCVWPEVDPDAHAGRLILWVGDRPLAAGKPVAWPLARTGRSNIFEPVPVGVDQRGRPVLVTLMFASGVVGAIPRMGKTFGLRLVALAGALDPRTELHAYNLKGGSDFDPLAAVAHAYRTGDDIEDIDYLLADLRGLAGDRRRRYRTLRGLPRDVCPESKVTDELASERTLGLQPVLVIIDECQLAFEHPQHGPEIVALVTDLVKAGPAVGIMVWCATQRPDAKSLPRDISANAVLRLALKVTGQVENDMILGTSAYKNGVRATMLSRRDRGVAILAGEGDDPQIVRLAYLDSVTAEAVTARARTARTLAGLLTGHAAGLDPDIDPDTTGVLDDLVEVWPAGTHRVWCDELAGRLATTWPGRYDGWSGEQVTAAVKPHGLSTVQVKRTVDGRQSNRRGLDLGQVRAALTHRDGGEDLPSSDDP